MDGRLSGTESGRSVRKGTRKARRDDGLGLRAPSVVAKNFVLDTNVLLHDPGCLNRFADNHVCIPVDVLAELDRFKNEQSDRGANARSVHRHLSALFSEHPNEVLRGVATPGGGSVRLVVFDPEACEKQGATLKKFFRVFPDRGRIDHRILACVLMIHEANPSPVILVTKDLNMQLKARAVGLGCQDYLSDKVDAKHAHHQEIRRIEAAPQELQRLASSNQLQMDAGRTAKLYTNEYVLLEAGPGHTLPARFDAHGVFRRLALPDGGVRIPNGRHIKALNLGQQCFLDAMLDPDISLITCYGQAGTGKTLLAVAAGLSGVYDRTYSGLTVSRPVVAMGDTVGFLPGTLHEKMHPWLQPIYDALELVLRPEPQANGGPKRKRGKVRETVGGGGPQHVGTGKIFDPLIEQGIVEIEALCYIRGRSIPNRFFVLDEAQQLTPLEAKTVVTRMSQGSKLILVGDPAQIDNPYVDSRSNGLVYTRNRMCGQPFAAHVSLTKGERSPLAEAGAELM